ncbi:unnamed protein product [Effrenium voratum]|uniref:Uncharacterized protein n=1 Tax=Effrenium voratum TaxID=2562239 RepID=A0AA36NMH8_9DINO|nr:unnamed protein product [Effrenium voratum]
MPIVPLHVGGTAGMKVEKIKEENAEQVGDVPGIKLESPIKKELRQPGEDSVQPVKRPRLRRHDMQVGQNVADACGKIGMKEEGLDLHSFWLQVKQEVKEEAQSMDKIEAGMVVKEEHAESSHQVASEAVAPITVKAEPQAGGSVSKLEKVKMEPARLPEASTAGVVKVEPGSSAEARPQRTDPADGKPAPPEFEEQVALWARQCAEFRKRATWMPTRPCCPANVFFSNPVAPQENDPPCVQRLSQKELSCLRRFFERGHPVFSAALETGPTAKVPTRAVSGAAAASAAAQEEAGLPASGAACMKMWPWMRDLPSNIWAGRGWAYDEQSGPRRLSSSGGADAMKGVQVWESIGTAEQPAAALEQPRPVDRAAPGQSASLVPAVPNHGVKPARVLSKQQEKQSGVPGISWDSSSFRWQLRWTETGQKGGEAARHIQNFSASGFMKDGLNEAEAEAAALEAAKAFRAQLVAQGRIKEKLRDQSLTSDVPGVKFEKARKKWRVMIPKAGGGSICGGCFTEKAEAEARALQLRELHGLQRTVKASASREEHAAAVAQLPVFQPKVPFPGVNWERKKQSWHAQLTRNKRKKDSRFKPLDHSEAELEKAFVKAVAWLKKQRKEMASQGMAAKGKKGKSKKA